MRYPLSILGGGRLTRALLAGLGPGFPPIPIYLRDSARLPALGKIGPPLQPVGTLRLLAATPRLLFVAVPPAATLDLDGDLVEAVRASGSILVSCAGGVSLPALEERYPSTAVARLLPNILWEQRGGTTLYRANGLVPTEALEDLRELLGMLGVGVPLADEADFDRLGMVTACGPGLVAALLEEIARTFALQGFERRLLMDLFAGTIENLRRTGRQPEELIHEVAVPGGLTEVGVAALLDKLPEALGITKTRMQEKIARRAAQLAPLSARTRLE